MAIVSILVKRQAAFCGKQDKVEGVDRPNEKDRSKDRSLWNTTQHLDKLGRPATAADLLLPTSKVGAWVIGH